MAVNIPSLNVNAIGEGLKDQNNYEAILDILQRYRKELNFYLMNLDLDNMPAVAENIDWIHQDIDGVKITVGNNAGDIAALSIRADEISATVANNIGDIAALSIRADQISASVSDNAGNIAALNVTAGQIQSSVADLNTYTNEQLVLIDGKFQTVNTTISNQYSSITQRADAIEASVGNVVTSVSNLSTTVTQNHSNITQRANSIESTVTSITSQITGINTAITNQSSTISQLAGSISSKVSLTDYNGVQIVSLIEQTASNIKLSASKIDLSGVTTIYNPNGSYTTMYGQGIHIVAKLGQSTWTYPIVWDTFISFELGRGVGTVFPDVVNFDGPVGFNDDVHFTNATIYGLELRFA